MLLSALHVGFYLLASVAGAALPLSQPDIGATTGDGFTALSKRSPESEAKKKTFMDDEMYYEWAKPSQTKDAQFHAWHAVYPGWESSLRTRPLPQLNDYNQFLEKYKVSEKAAEAKISEEAMAKAGIAKTQKFRYIEICSKASAKTCYDFYLSEDGKVIMTDYIFGTKDDNNPRMNSGQIAGYSRIWTLVNPVGGGQAQAPTKADFDKLGDIETYVSFNVKEDPWQYSLKDINAIPEYKGVGTQVNGKWGTFTNADNKGPGDKTASKSTQAYFTMMGTNNGAAHTRFIQETQGAKQRVVGEFITSYKEHILITKFAAHPGLKAAPPAVPAKPKKLQSGSGAACNTKRAIEHGKGSKSGEAATHCERPTGTHHTSGTKPKKNAGTKEPIKKTSGGRVAKHTAKESGKTATKATGPKSKKSSRRSAIKAASIS